MADRPRGQNLHIESEYERRLRMCLDRALVCEWKSRPDKEGVPAGRLLVLANRFAVHELFDLIMRGGDEGCDLAAALFAHRAPDIDRAVRARFLTLLARALHDGDHDVGGEICESQVAFFGRFVNALLTRRKRRDDRMDGVVLAWVEDMNADDPETGAETQPTAVIRGILFAPSLDHRQAFGFWERAARSERFPDRIFSDPCPPDEGSIFSSYAIRAFGLFFSVAPEGAVDRFAAHLRDNATGKKVHEWVADTGRWTAKVVPATGNDRQRVFDGIAGYIDNGPRKQKVHAILHAA